MQDPPIMFWHRASARGPLSVVPAATVLASTVLVVAGLMTGALANDIAKDAWPATVDARYRLKFQGIEVGKLDFRSETTAGGYKINGGARLSLLLGVYKIKTDGNAVGLITPAAGGAVAQPRDYAFDWQGGKKRGSVKLGFDGSTAKRIAVDPPAEPSPERIPLLDKHTTNVFDPISAIMVLTRNDGKPCDKRVPVFDGKHRFDIVFSPKGQRPLPASAETKTPETGIVCRVSYVPIAGHKQKAETEHFAQNKDMEVILRRVPGSDLLVPHTVLIPTGWGTASMVFERMDVATAKLGRIALRD